MHNTAIALMVANAYRAGLNPRNAIFDSRQEADKKIQETYNTLTKELPQEALRFLTAIEDNLRQLNQLHSLRDIKYDTPGSENALGPLLNAVVMEMRAYDKRVHKVSESSWFKEIERPYRNGEGSSNPEA